MQLKHIAFLTLSAVSTFAMAEGFDVVVVGSGGAGLSSAITAKESGATVVVLEKMAYIGGNSNFASGGMNAAGTKQQLAAGVTQDSPELFYKDTMKGGHNLNNPALLKTLTENAKYAEEWLVDLGAKFCFRKGRGGGQSIARGHGPCDGSAVGPEILRVLTERAAKDGIAIRTENQVVKIVMKNGAVAGVEVKTEDGVKTIDARAVVLATGGFGANQAMVTKYRPELKGFSTTNHPGALGEGIKLGEDVGASLTDIEQIQIHPTVSQETSALITEGLRGDGAILVNSEGKRFFDEVGTRDAVSAAEVAQPGGFAWLIVDNKMVEASSVIAGYIKQGLTVEGADVEALAAAMGVDGAALVETMDKWNACVEAGKDEEFGRTSFANKLDEGPYYAIKVAPGVHHTMGGLKINPNTEVLDASGNAIAGLYAAGEVTGGVHGANRLGGNAVADIIVFGRIAGQQAAAYAE